MAFKLKADPTFKAEVRIPLPGGVSEPVVFEFRHRTLAELGAFQTRCATEAMTTVNCMREIIVGWSLDDEFNDANLDLLCQSYMKAPQAIIKAYFDELAPARLGN